VESATELASADGDEATEPEVGSLSLVSGGVELGSVEDGSVVAAGSEGSVDVGSLGVVPVEVPSPPVGSVGAAGSVAVGSVELPVDGSAVGSGSAGCVAVGLGSGSETGSEPAPVVGEAEVGLGSAPEGLDVEVGFPPVTGLEPVPEPVPELAPEPVPEPAPEPVPELAPEPVPELAPKPVPELAPEPDAGGLVGFAGEDVGEMVVVGDEPDEDDFGNGVEIGEAHGFDGTELEGLDGAELEERDRLGGGTGDPTRGLAAANAWVGAPVCGAGVVCSFA
jgi:hypothetical protein